MKESKVNIHAGNKHQKAEYATREELVFAHDIKWCWCHMLPTGRYY